MLPDGDKSSNVHGHSHGHTGNNLPQPSGLLRASRVPPHRPGPASTTGRWRRPRQVSTAGQTSACLNCDRLRGGLAHEKLPGRATAATGTPPTPPADARRGGHGYDADGDGTRALRHNRTSPQGRRVRCARVPPLGPGSARWMSASADAQHKMPVEHLSKIVIYELNGQTASACRGARRAGHDDAAASTSLLTYMQNPCNSCAPRASYSCNRGGLD